MAGRAFFVLLAGVASSSCGYGAVYGGRGSERLHVKLVRTLVPDVIASDEVAAGARDELALGGALEAGDGFPRLEIEVLREDEASEGIAYGASASSGSGGGGTPAPVARATDVGLVARAWVVSAPGSAPEDDTGDMRTEEVLAVDGTPGALSEKAVTADMFHFADGLRAAARRLGHKLASRVLGEPAASEDENLRRTR
jgi:hypothetical protein